jgi:hypothetical protein
MKVEWGRDVWIVFRNVCEQNEDNKKLFFWHQSVQKIWK